MDTSHAAALASLLGDEARVLTEPLAVEQLSRDFYWYSPVLRKQLDGKVGGPCRAARQRPKRFRACCAIAMLTIFP